MARPGTENHGTEKYWHGTARKILARKNIGTAWPEKVSETFFGENIFWSKNPILPGSKIPLLAIHKIISHIWEDAPRKVNNDEPDLRFFHGNF